MSLHPGLQMPSPLDRQLLGVVYAKLFSSWMKLCDSWFTASKPRFGSGKKRESQRLPSSFHGFLGPVGTSVGGWLLVAARLFGCLALDIILPLDLLRGTTCPKTVVFIPKYENVKKNRIPGRGPLGSWARTFRNPGADLLVNVPRHQLPSFMWVKLCESKNRFKPMPSWSIMYIYARICWDSHGYVGSSCCKGRSPQWPGDVDHPQAPRLAASLRTFSPGGAPDRASHLFAHFLSPIYDPSKRFKNNALW